MDYKTTPPEPTISGKCTHCDGDLYAGCDYVHERSEAEWYCDDECFVQARRKAGDLVTEAIECA
jgi:hypothetical protein